MKYFKKLVGRKVYLSPINPADYEKYCEWFNHLNTTILLGFATSNVTLQGEKESLEKLSKDHNYAIIKLNGDILIGKCGFNVINHIHRTATISISIGDTSNRGKGYGTEALELLLCYGFKILNLNNIMLEVYSFNKPALRSYEKLGFKVFGSRTSSFLINGEYHDTIYMELLKKDFTSNILAEVFNNIIS